MSDTLYQNVFYSIAHIESCHKTLLFHIKCALTHHSQAGGGTACRLPWALLHKKGFDAKSIQPLLGLADASTTANIYIHSQEDDLLDLANTLENSLNKKANAG